MNDEIAYNKVKELKQICLSSKSQREAKSKVKAKYWEVLQELKAYRELSSEPFEG